MKKRDLLITLWIVLGIMMPTYLFASDGDQIDNDEVVVFFPSYGYFDASQYKWILNIEGWIYEPNNSSVLRALVKGGYELFTGEGVQNESDFWNRIRPLVSDNESKEKIIITLGNKNYNMPESTGGGRITGQVSVSSEEIKPDAQGWVSYYTTAADGRIFKGKVQLIDTYGRSIISDIDDTIKITGVYISKKEAIKNTFNRVPQASPGMPELYQKMNDATTHFHYLTGSPWQLYEFLNKFCTTSNFPAGTFHMKEFRLNPTSSEFWEAIASDATIDQKKTAIKNIVQTYPNHQFILIGDSGEKDPEIYGWAAATYGDQITDVYIRNVTDETINNSRMKAAFGSNLHKLQLIK